MSTETHDERVQRLMQKAIERDPVCECGHNRMFHMGPPFEPEQLLDPTWRGSDHGPFVCIWPDGCACPDYLGETGKP